MKQLLLIALLLMMAGCEKDLKHKVILFKSYQDYDRNPMPKDICRFAYRQCSICDITEFSDSCNKYNVGDTILGTTKP